MSKKKKRRGTSPVERTAAKRGYGGLRKRLGGDHQSAGVAWLISEKAASRHSLVL
jgi:hypothetical protein